MQRARSSESVERSPPLSGVMDAIDVRPVAPYASCVSQYVPIHNSKSRTARTINKRRNESTSITQQRIVPIVQPLPR